MGPSVQAIATFGVETDSAPEAVVGLDHAGLISVEKVCRNHGPVGSRRVDRVAGQVPGDDDLRDAGVLLYSAVISESFAARYAVPSRCGRRAARASVHRSFGQRGRAAGRRHESTANV